MITVPAHRNVDLDQLRRMLTDQSTRALDVKAGAGRMRAVGGSLVLDGTEPQLGPEGVTMTSGAYSVNDVATAGLADKLGIPVAYLRSRRRTPRPVRPQRQRLACPRPPQLPHPLPAQ
ncbi:hypothetical protein [Micromonospora sp. NPDC050276]|uniref:hypothetical protein n=1 Tax=Micromonospora sp. NPDC050276 TaxID=3364278 RepID=UPI00379F09B3